MMGKFLKFWTSTGYFTNSTNYMELAVGYPYSFKHVFMVFPVLNPALIFILFNFVCVFFDLYQTTHQSSIGVQLRKVDD